MKRISLLLIIAMAVISCNKEEWLKSGDYFFIDHKDMGVRLRLCGIASLGMVLGSTMMLLMIRAGWGVGVDAIP